MICIDKIQRELLELKGVLKNQRSSKDDRKRQNFVVVSKDKKSKRKKTYVESPVFDRHLKDKSMSEIIKEIEQLKHERQNSNRKVGEY